MNRSGRLGDYPLKKRLKIAFKAQEVLFHLAAYRNLHLY
jgi:hypothetical protein